MQFEDEAAGFPNRTDGGCELKKGLEKTPPILVCGCAGRANLRDGGEISSIMNKRNWTHLLALHGKVLSRPLGVRGRSLWERWGQEIGIEELSAYRERHGTG